MSTLRQWLQERIVRLDGARERRAIALGALALFFTLLAGPHMLRAVTTLAERPAGSSAAVMTAATGTEPAHPPLPVIEPASDLTAPPDATGMAAALPPPANQPMPPKRPPVLAFLFPLADAEQIGPVRIMARITDATAVGVVFVVQDAAGNVRNLPAASEAGLWNAQFEGASGSYMLSARASLENGFVSEFDMQRGFRIAAPPEASPTSVSVAEEPAADVRLLAPFEGQSAPFEGIMPLYASVQDALPEDVIFVVRDGNGAEMTVTATGTPDGGFWSGLFTGPDGRYDVRARATVDGMMVFSEDRRFFLRGKATAPSATGTQGISVPKSPGAPTVSVRPEHPTSSATAPLPPRRIAPLAPGPSSSSVVTGASSPSTPVSATLALECKKSGVSEKRCSGWLEAKYQSRACLDAGIGAREDCAAFLKRQGMAADDKALFGLFDRASLGAIRTAVNSEIAGSLSPSEMPPLVRSVLPFDPVGASRWRFVVPRPGNSLSAAAPALMMPDGDGDGLPDDLESRLGTDPNAADSDHDGFSDGVETINGYNPVGDGPLSAPLQGIDKALAGGGAIGEPRQASAADAHLSIGVAPAGGTGAALTLEGKGKY